MSRFPRNDTKPDEGTEIEASKMLMLDRYSVVSLTLSHASHVKDDNDKVWSPGTLGSIPSPLPHPFIKNVYIWHGIRWFIWVNYFTAHMKFENRSADATHFIFNFKGTKKLWLNRGLNPRPLVWRTSTLPTQLSSPMLAVPQIVNYLCSGLGASQKP